MTKFKAGDIVRHKEYGNTHLLLSVDLNALIYNYIVLYIPGGTHDFVGSFYNFGSEYIGEHYEKIQDR